MKVLVLPSWYPTRLNPFDSDYVKYQTGLLKRYGIDIHVCFADLNFRYFLTGPRIIKHRCFVDENDVSTNVLEGPYLPKNSAVSLNLWLEKYYQFVDKSIKHSFTPDLIHAHSYLGGYVSSKLKQSRGIPYVVTEHFTGFLSGKIRRNHWLKAQLAFATADRCFTVSEGFSSHLTSEFNRSFSTIPNFIDTDLFHPSSSKHRQFTFVYVGDLIKRKQVDLLVEAFARLIHKNPDIRLRLIGDGPEKEDLKNLVESMGLTETVEFRGSLSQIDVGKELRLAHCLVLPSKLETFGIVLIEALSSGVPVISFYNIGSDKVFDSSHGLHLEDQNAESLCHGMQQLMENHTKYDPVELRNHVMKNFSGVELSKKLLSQYSQVIG